MARTCRACGGVLGRDCFNEIECMSISASEESYQRGRFEELKERFERLLEILHNHNIDVTGLVVPKQETSTSIFVHDPNDNLPF